jgi:hypothetical protein
VRTTCDAVGARAYILMDAKDYMFRHIFTGLCLEVCAPARSLLRV